ncbi:hypothetical protein ABW21_db0207842 [Orbilia brochopaga]|nr:hypothetical protein ABW21_db0207842 [Drechslerella brochopaga]
MSDPYGERYRRGRGTEPRYEYPPEEYYPPPAPYGRGSGGPPPLDPGYERVYRDPGPIYDRTGGYDMPPSRGVPRNDYPPQPLRPDDYTSRRPGGSDYQPPPQDPRRSVRDPGYPDLEYYPPPPGSDRHRLPPRDYERYPPEVYRGEETRRRIRRPDDADYDPTYRGDYEPYYEEPAAPGRRQPQPPIGYTRGGPYEADIPPSRSRRSRDPGVKIPPSKSSPEAHDDEFTLPAEGIDKAIIQKYITRFLGNDATSRGPMPDKEIIQHLDLPFTALDARGRDGPGPAMPSLQTTRTSGRRNTDEDPTIMTDMPSDQYIYSTTANPGSRVSAREMRAGRSPHDAYGTSYHEPPPARHTRAPIEARQGQVQDEDDEMED